MVEVVACRVAPAPHYSAPMIAEAGAQQTSRASAARRSCVSCAIVWEPCRCASSVCGG